MAKTVTQFCQIKICIKLFIEVKYLYFLFINFLMTWWEGPAYDLLKWTAKKGWEGV